MNIGLLGLSARLLGRSRKLAITGAVLAVIGAVASVVQLASLDIQHMPAVFVGLGQAFGTGLAPLLGGVVIGVAALRTGTLARPIAWTLVAAIVTVPVLLVTPLPVGPAWATDTLAFLLSGAAYAAIGAGLPPAQSRAAANLVARQTGLP